MADSAELVAVEKRNLHFSCRESKPTRLSDPQSVLAPVLQSTNIINSARLFASEQAEAICKLWPLASEECRLYMPFY
jgi:hypothetical protein